MAEKLLMTALSPTMEQGTVAQWLKTEGEAIKNGDVICEIETDKAVMEYEADFDAVLLKIVIADYGEAGEDFSDLIDGIAVIAAEPVATEVLPEAAPAMTPSGRRLRVSPLARRMADSSGIDINSVKGSGTEGRIIKRDIEALMSNVVPNTTVQPAGALTPSANLSTHHVSGMRTVIAERLSASKFSAPHYYLTVQVDMSAVLAAVKKNEERRGLKISVNSYLLKFSGEALMRHQVVNSTWNKGAISVFNSADIGFAVALEDGLITPVVRNCEQKGITVIDGEFRTLAEKAKEGRLSPVEYNGAGFTISNLGSFGIEEFTAIINPPGSAILAVGAIIKKSVVVTDDSGDYAVIKPMMKMTLSCDHRVIDGAVGAAFLADLKRMLEDPIEALM
jgi:pyruvate dehydrogenase E2 component (dihydrolipoamide acetyltransferase)